jgi:hypothetical protein
MQLKKLAWRSFSRYDFFPLPYRFEEWFVKRFLIFLTFLSRHP